jgi:hypothetical protein
MLTLHIDHLDLWFGREACSVTSVVCLGLFFLLPLGRYVLRLLLGGKKGR